MRPRPLWKSLHLGIHPLPAVILKEGEKEKSDLNINREGEEEGR